MRTLAISVLGISALVLASGCATASGSKDDEPLEAMGSTESEVVGASQRIPDFQKLWDAYPHGTADEVKSLIGGAVDADWIVNTCTIRMSRAMNYAGFVIPSGPSQSANGFHTVKGADKKNYGYRVAEYRAFMLKTFGKPSIEVVTKADKGVEKTAFEGHKGIVLYEVKIWSDATGHADLWDGEKPAHDEYFDVAAKVQLWE